MEFQLNLNPTPEPKAPTTLPIVIARSELNVFLVSVDHDTRTVSGFDSKSEQVTDNLTGKEQKTLADIKTKVLSTADTDGLFLKVVGSTIEQWDELPDVIDYDFEGDAAFLGLVESELSSAVKTSVATIATLKLEVLAFPYRPRGKSSDENYTRSHVFLTRDLLKRIRVAKTMWTNECGYPVDMSDIIEVSVSRYLKECGF